MVGLEEQLYDNYVLEHLKEHNFQSIKELHTYINDYFFLHSDKYYVIEEKYFRMSVIDAFRYEVRLQEIDQFGELIVNESGKINRVKLNIDKFEAIAEVYNILKV